MVRCVDGAVNALLASAPTVLDWEDGIASSGSTEAEVDSSGATKREGSVLASDLLTKPSTSAHASSVKVPSQLSFHCAVA
jgi:hypothetical protein